MVFAQVNCNINNLYFLDDQYQCVSSCPDGYYLAHTPDPVYNINLNQCLVCDDSCKTCNGPTPQSCLSCSKAYLLNNMCYKIRPNNTYCDENNNCKGCTKIQNDQTTPMCKFCDISLMNCLLCYNPNQYLYKQICYVERPISTYCDSQNICEDCFINCQSCYQITSKDCLSCKQPFLFYQNQCICPDLSQTYNTETKQCEFKELSMFPKDIQQKLQDGGNALNQIAEWWKCCELSNIRDDSINPISSSNPLTLTSSSTAIRYSQFPYKFNIDVTQGIILGITGVEVCFYYIRFEVLTQQYNQVDLNFYSYQYAYSTWYNTQFIGGQAQIMVFAQVNCIINNLYFLDDQYQCVSSCPDGYYLAHTPDPIYQIILNQCLACDASCKTCNGSTPQSCLSCSQAYLLNSMCYKIMPNNTYCDENNNCKECIKMQSDQTTPMCNVCDKTLMNCLQCYNSKYYLYKQICYVERPIRIYCDSKNICEDCFINCESCYQTTKKDCLSCNQPFILSQNQCICPDMSQIYNIETKQCEFKVLSVFSQDAQKKLQNYGNAVNQVSFGMSIGFTIAQGFIRLGCPLLSQTLTSQKIFYLELINISIPQFLLQFMK
ncbi:hypothetical protein ABPG73_018192 [Tetrahymena malaccensis]